MSCSLTGRMYLLRPPVGRLRRRVSYRARASRMPPHDARFRLLQEPASGPDCASRFAPEWEPGSLSDRYVGRGFSAVSAVLVEASERGISAGQKMPLLVRSWDRFPGPLPASSPFEKASSACRFQAAVPALIGLAWTTP